jgi:hypothetical protein
MLLSTPLPGVLLPDPVAPVPVAPALPADCANAGAEIAITATVAIARIVFT